MLEENNLSRRKVLSGLGAGLAAAAVAPVLGAQAAPLAPPAVPLQD
ncbi:MAG: NAD(P)-dependent oxidoreductase, partial [Cytophagaceae bacterium]